MNRRERRANAKKAQSSSRPASAMPKASPLTDASNRASTDFISSGVSLGNPSTPSAQTGQPAGLVLRLFARLLLAKWIMKRVNHPDIVAILLQVAQQTGRVDAVAELTLKLYSIPR